MAGASKARLLVTAAAALIVANRAAAAAPEISEAEFLALLDEAHPAIVALGGELAEALGERKTPRTGNPGVSFEREAPERGAAQSTVKLTWRPPLDTRRGLANDAAQAGLAAAEQRLDWDRLRLRAELRGLFAEWSLATARRDLLADVAERTERLAARGSARASTGEDTGLSARRLGLAAAQSRAALAEAEADLIDVRARLRSLFPDLDATARPRRPGLPPAPPRAAGAARADVRARELDVERAEAARRLAGRFLEFPALVGGWTVQEDDADGTDGPVLGVEWDLPLFDRDQGERSRAEQRLRVARAELALAKSRAASELEAALAVYEELRAVADEVMEATDGIAAIVEAATAEFQAGEAGLTDLLETIRSATEGRMAALHVHDQALAAHRRLELGMGRSLDDGGSR